jgi:hypothetical protein
MAREADDLAAIDDRARRSERFKRAMQRVAARTQLARRFIRGDGPGAARRHHVAVRARRRRMSAFADPGPPSLARAGLAGLLATLAMDVGARMIIAPVLGFSAPGPKYFGRWVGHMRTGRFVHDDIATAAPIEHEAAIGIVAHYAIGVTLGEGYGLLLRVRGRRGDSLRLALVYGTATTAFPWFLLFPATGQGALGRRAGARLSVLSLLNHVVYGLGLGSATRSRPH